VSEDSEAYEKNNHRHIFDISESRSSLTGGLFFSYNEAIGQKGSLQRAHLCVTEFSSLSVHLELVNSEKVLWLPIIKGLI